MEYHARGTLRILLACIIGLWEGLHRQSITWTNLKRLTKKKEVKIMGKKSFSETGTSIRKVLEMQWHMLQQVPICLQYTHKNVTFRIFFNEFLFVPDTSPVPYQVPWLLERILKQNSSRICKSPLCWDQLDLFWETCPIARLGHSCPSPLLLLWWPPDGAGKAHVISLWKGRGVWVCVGPSLQALTELHLRCHFFDWSVDLIQQL